MAGQGKKKYTERLDGDLCGRGAGNIRQGKLSGYYFMSNEEIIPDKPE
jgi:hypothetical protein